MSTKNTAKIDTVPDYKIVIPARYSSKRLPGKPLREIAGHPMIEHTFRNASKTSASEVIIATDDTRIAQCAKEFGGDCCMTAATHSCGSERVCEVAVARGWSDETIIVNVQGDEPFIDPATIDQLAVQLVGHPQASITTLASVHPPNSDFTKPDKVKVVCNPDNFALYFSRSAIPAGAGIWFYHHGIYAYRCSYLKQFTALGQPYIEVFEKLEQLRALAAGHDIYVHFINPPICFGIDSEADIEKASQLLKGIEIL